jgi:hypothetical protein
MGSHCVGLTSGTVLMCVMAASATAQDDLRWITRYDGPGGYIDNPRCTAVDAEGFVYVAGATTATRPPSVDDPNQLDMVTLKYSPEGELVWERRYGGGRSFYEGPGAMVVDDEGHVFVTGTAAHVDSLRSDIVTLKYDSRGELLWARHGFGGSQAYGGGTAIVLDGEGGVVTTGYSSVGAGELKSMDIVTVRYDAEGNILWQRSFASAEGGADRAWALARDKDGNYVVAGQADAAPDWLGNSTHDVVTIQYDSQGRLCWVARYDGLSSAEDAGYAVRAGPSGNVYVTGETRTTGQDWTGDDSITLAYSREGTLLWASRFDGPGKSADRTDHIALDEEENVFVGGFSMSQAGYPDTDLLVIKLDRMGRRLWVKTIPNPHGFKTSGHVSGLVLGMDGNALIAGTDPWAWRALRLSSADGSVTWESYLGPSSSLGLFSPNGGIALTPEGDLVMSGMATPGVWPDFDILTLKLRPD